MRYSLLIHFKGHEEDKDEDGNPKPVECHKPYEAANFVRYDGQCPRCLSTPLDLKLMGEIEQHKEHHYAPVGCHLCGAHVGTIKETPESIFGEDEDRRVLHGRYHVY